MASRTVTFDLNVNVLEPSHSRSHILDTYMYYLVRDQN